MAVQMRVLFLLCLSILFTAGFANYLDNVKDDIDTSEVTSVKINELFDSMLPSIRSFILEHGLDPLKLKDISENLQGVIIHKRTLNLSNGWLQGLSNVRRTSDVIFSYKDKVLTLDAILAFDLADISYQYFYKDLLISRKGDIHGRVRNMRIRLIVALDMNKYKIAVPMSKIINMDKFSITLEGNKIDPIVNAAIKVVANAFRTKIINMVNEEFSKMVQGFVQDINGKIPSPDRILDVFPKHNLV
ncbi:PREDICTED: uncharacterized protein LOC108554090 [Eufriesea mexicana]|uniref:uncharacterized protein LOC108554090 n=1 Tax=Eufriesea mexicana TaxID=516756 RepID=UPI00083BCA21|nr:PREDICTED: uncharacterized protein LOC108554090 [Eufriesea mexicana]